jgi:hypothetical protein
MPERNYERCLTKLQERWNVSLPLHTMLFIWKMWTLDRTAAGWENPRSSYEAPEYGMTLASRQRQLHDEDKSCGIQPAYIRVIYRRLSLLFCSKFIYSKETYKRR